jgi:hypothetical protein
MGLLVVGRAGYIAAMAADGTFTTRVDRIYQPPILQP